ncbi:MAG: ABC transporter permease [Rhizomicrobium sp.]
MFRNYLVTALRNFTRHRLYSFINIGGLALALACATFIALFVADELSYDRFIPDMGNVYRVDTAFKLPGHDVQRADDTTFVLGPTMKAQIPQVLAYTHITSQTVTLKVKDRLFSQDVQVVDPDFFQVIHLPMIAGDPKQVFAQPDSIVLSQAEAIKLFGGTAVMGRTVVVSGNHPMIVTGIVKDLPHNTQLKANALFPDTSKADPMQEFYKKHWESFGGHLYVELAPGSDTKQVLAMTRHLFDSHIDLKKEAGVDIPASKVFDPHLTPFLDGHLNDYGGGMTPGDSWTEVYGFSAIAVLILLIACFNFTNLATARAMMRAREVSLRKVMGARRGQLIVQFLAESIVTALAALVLALALVEVPTPAYERFVDRPIALHYLSDWGLIIFVVVAAALTGLLAGIYPAFVLSGFRPAGTLRANASGRSGSALLRTALVVLQFAISIGLGVAAVVVFAQIRYAEQVNLGFNRSHIVVIRNASDIPKAKREDFERTVEAEPSIEGAALSRSTPFDGTTNIQTVAVPGSPQLLSVREWEADPNYPSVYQLKLLAGRLLSRDRAQDVYKQDGKSSARSC